MTNRRNFFKQATALAMGGLLLGKTESLSAATKAVNASTGKKNIGLQIYSLFDEQFYRRASTGFLDLTLRAFDAVLHPAVHIQSEETPDQKFFHFNGLCVSNLVWRYLVTNENWRYILGDLTSDLPLKDIRIVNDFRGRPMRLEERTDGLPGVRSFVRIPPKGIGVLDIEFSERRKRAVADFQRIGNQQSG